MKPAVLTVIIIGTARVFISRADGKTVIGLATARFPDMASRTA